MLELPFTLKTPFEHGTGFCWRAELPIEMAWACDSNERPRHSPLVLCEGSRQLGPGHVPHAEIESLGLGRYSFWCGTVYFAASGNSDPNHTEQPYRVIMADRHSGDVVTRHRDATIVEAPQAKAAIGIVGLGQRGRGLARWLRGISSVTIAAIHDPSSVRVEDFVRTVMGGAVPRVHQSLDEIIADPALDGLIIATPDHMHARHAVAALEGGKPLFLEKPIATTIEDGRAIVAASRRTGLPVQVGFVLRYSEFYEAIRDEIRNGAIGPVISLDLCDHMSLDHGASYRRRWHRRSAWSGGLIVHKGCHDLDLVEWLTNQTICAVTSTGGLGPLGRRLAPATHCSVCPEAVGCRHRFSGKHVFVADSEYTALTAHDIDRCVYGLDQDIVEIQTVLMELSGGAHASLRIDMFNPLRTERPIRVVGERGTIIGKLRDASFEVQFNDGRSGYRVIVSGDGHSHGGGDIHSLHNFLRALSEGHAVDASLDDAFRGLCAGIAAETSRRDGRTVEIVTE